VKRIVEVGEARKPEASHPANPDRAVGDARAVVPPPRIYWARTVPPEELAGLLARHIVEENCEHVSLRHCPRCVEGHLDDLIAHVYEHF